MDFREMIYITTVADCQSVTAAAKKLYISQPSLSQIVSKVEQDLGVKLFDRKAYPITLTFAGEKYVDTARRILMMNDNLRRELMDIGLGQKGKISLGIPTERAGYMLPSVLKQFRELYPMVEVRIVESKADDLIQAIMKGEIDFFILPRKADELPVGLKTELIYKERLFIVAEPGSITPDMCFRGEEQVVNLSQLKDFPVIFLKKGHAIRKKSDSVYKNYKILPNIVMEVSSCISAVLLAASGLGITLVPERAVKMLGGTEKFCCFTYSKKPDTWDVNVVYQEAIYLDRAKRCLIDLMKKEFRDV